MPLDEYSAVVQEAEGRLLSFLRTFESVQETFRIERLAELQAQVREVAPDGFAEPSAELGRANPPESLQGFHDSLTAAIRHLGNASQTFLNANENSYSLDGLDIRRALYRGYNLLYGVREHTLTLRQYWLLPNAMDDREDLENAIL